MSVPRTSSRSVLVVGSGEAGALEGVYARALRKAGAQVELFDVAPLRIRVEGAGLFRRALNAAAAGLSARRAERGLVDFLRKRREPFDAVLIFKGMEFSRDALEACRRIHPSAFWVNVNPDDPQNVGSRGSTNGNVVESLSFFDLYCIWSRRLVPRLLAAGCRRVEYLPFGYDPDVHRPPREVRSDLSRSVTFVGAWDPERESVLAGLCHFDLRVFGASWERVSARSPLARCIVPRNLYGQELAGVLHGSAVSLNLLRPQNASAHNMRTFEIPAVGGVMLTTRSEEQARFFPEGEGCFMFGDRTELRAKVEAALAGGPGVDKVRSGGLGLVAGHSYVDRAEVLLGMAAARPPSERTGSR